MLQIAYPAAYNSFLVPTGSNVFEKAVEFECFVRVWIIFFPIFWTQKNIPIHRIWRFIIAQIAQPFEHLCFFVVLFAPIHAPLSAGQEQLTKLEKSTPKKWFFCLFL